MASPDIQDLRRRVEGLLPQCRLKDRWAAAQKIPSLFPPKNPEAVAQELQKWHKRLQRSAATVRKRTNQLPAISLPEELPVAAHEKDILEALQEHPVLVLAGETGSGKTTQIPKLCLKAGFGLRGKIGCTQPRRIAALSVSRRVAEELRVPWGEDVGASIRFQDRTSPRTLIKFMTDGILLNELQRDPLLLDYEVLIVDEAHERSLNIDFILGFLRRLRDERPDLKIIITSATIDTGRFSEAFGGAPIIEVSGRLYPVEVEYRPVNHPDSEDSFYENTIEATAGVTREIVTRYPFGDILIFMSGERAIREARDQLEGLALPQTDILPLFGRLSSADQQKIFKPSNRRRIVIATNIAETSITIPGIRYVIDTGLARISRYSPHTRTRRLPIEPISQSSARQRAGRCGRVQAGVCFRLYTEEELLSRPEYTQPEILRSNLASVLLQLLDMNIHDVEAFPFIDPPSPAALRGGANLLRELKAIDAENHLTPLGRKLARMPVDPTIATMLLHAPRETCLREILVIAAGLSIQDPRERPADAESAADQAHRQFQHPESDFLSLYLLLYAFKKKKKIRSRNGLRKWCKDNYISYLRLREWKDIHSQLVEVLKEMNAYRIHDLDTDYRAVHRTILTGLLGNVARRDRGNHYHATHSRKVMLFPGSVLFDQKARSEERKKKKNPPTRTPEWILAGEWLETSRLFARTAARIDPDWILDLGRHLFRESVSEPVWDPEKGRVLATRRVLLYGLEVERKRVGYVRYDPEEATRIFIQSALVEENLEHPPPWMDHNRRVRKKIEAWQTQTRRVDALSLHERLTEFFENALEGAAVGSLADLNRWLKEDPGRRERLLFKEADLLQNLRAAYDADAFPTEVTLGNETLPIEYSFQPGETDDGATLKVSLAQFEVLREGLLDWVVPGYIEEKVEALLRGLPKAHRLRLHPLGETAEVLIRSLKPGPEPFLNQLSRLIESRYHFSIPPEDWNTDVLPDHLKVRVEVTDQKSRPLFDSRNWKNLEQQYAQRIQNRLVSGAGGDRLEAWKRAADQWERSGIRRWDFGDLPESLSIGEIAGVPVEAWPGLARINEDSVSIRLFRNREEAERHSAPAVRSLASIHCARDLAWLRKDLRILKDLGPLVAAFSNFDDFAHDAWNHLLRHLLPLRPTFPLRQNRFESHCRTVCESTRGLAYRFLDRLRPVLELRQELATRKSAYPGLPNDLLRILPPDFLRRIEFSHLHDLHRYLRGLQIRAERYPGSPDKDREKWERFSPWLQRLNRSIANPPENPEDAARLNRLFWLLEEFRVSLFAQELGTATRVSPRRLEEEFATLENGSG